MSRYRASVLHLYRLGHNPMFALIRGIGLTILPGKFPEEIEMDKQYQTYNGRQILKKMKHTGISSR